MMGPEGLATAQPTSGLLRLRLSLPLAAGALANVAESPQGSFGAGFFVFRRWLTNKFDALP